MKILLIIAAILIAASVIYGLIQKLKNNKLKNENENLEDDNAVLSKAVDKQKERNMSLIKIFKETNEENKSFKEFENEVDKIELDLLSDNYSKQLHKLPGRNPRT